MREHALYGLYSSLVNVIIISAVALVLSTVILLTAAEERSSRAERGTRDRQLEGLLDLEICSAATRAKEDPSKFRSSPHEIAGRIMTLTERCLEYIDENKEGYVSICCIIQEFCIDFVPTNILLNSKVI